MSDDTPQITVKRLEGGIYAAHGPCPECPRDGYGTSRTQARRSMRHICHECRAEA